MNVLRMLFVESEAHPASAATVWAFSEHLENLGGPIWICGILLGILGFFVARFWALWKERVAALNIQLTTVGNK